MATETTRPVRVKSGDVVRLKSGGPPMTVGAAVRTMTSSVFVCHWFEGGQERRGDFDAAALEPSSPDRQPAADVVS
jgi:uncharacterized protein YodC (DUF2158 family)